MSKVWIVAIIVASGFAGGAVAQTPPTSTEPAPEVLSRLTLQKFEGGDSFCYDRSVQPQTPVVDTHLHFRPFGGPTIPFEDLVAYLRDAGVLFANVYGIGQMLPVDSPCTYYLDCPGTPVQPTLKNDFVNAANYLANASPDVHLTLSMSFPDLTRPETVLPGIRLLDQEFPGVFRWMGEVNLVKQAIFPNGRDAVEVDEIARWVPFMDVLRERGILLALHADLGSDADPTRYLPLIEEVLRRYPDNTIVWMHMGLSRELTGMDATEHIRIVNSLLDAYPGLLVDLAWRVIDDAYFSDPDKRALYVPFLNEYSDRVLPGSDFLASADKNFDVYRMELDITSRIFRYLDDTAFRNIALGENYFRLLGLEYQAPQVCATGESRRPFDENR